MISLLFAVKTIGLVVPVEHKALNEIVKGFKDTVKNKAIIQEKNAMGDQAMQRGILQNFNSTADLVATIATSTTQQAIQVCKDKNILGIAVRSSDFKPSKNVVFIDDEDSAEPLLTCINKNYPDIKTLAIIYSNNDKIIPEVENAEKICQKLGIEIKKHKIQQVSDVYTVIKNVKEQGIVVLKDVMVVSCMAAILKHAKETKIPVFVSDDMSVKQGADMGIAIREYDIGVQAGFAALDILEGKSTKQIIKVRNRTCFKRKNARPITSEFPVEEVLDGDRL